jgi:alkylated DNA repair dioxygenase AlkB
VVAIAFAPPAAISAALPGWHADRPADKLDEAVIPVLSLGATRRFLIKPDRGGRSTVITTHGGDLVVMGGRCQKDYKHSVPKQRFVAGPRLSLNFSASPPRPAVAAKGHR